MVLVEVPARRKNKSKRREMETVEVRPCGWDARLLWDDAAVEVWDGSRGDGVLCDGGKRCDRHQGWQKTVAAGLDVEGAVIVSSHSRAPTDSRTDGSWIWRRASSGPSDSTKHRRPAARQGKLLFSWKQADSQKRSASSSCCETQVMGRNPFSSALDMYHDVNTYHLYSHPYALPVQSTGTIFTGWQAYQAGRWTTSTFWFQTALKFVRRHR